MSRTTNRLDTTFARLRDASELGLFPYVTAGFPDRATCHALLDTVATAGADGLELGLPFSDPLADGVTLQRAGARALEEGTTLADTFELAASVRDRHDLPIVLMSYLNPLLAYGLDRVARDGVAAGLDGIIVPDLPFEESAELEQACAEAGLHLVQMVAPTSGTERLARVGARASGFVYCVALVGTTGARAALAPELPAFLAAARRAIAAPLVVGFGISTPDHLAGLVGQADGAIVASALADLVERTPPRELLPTVAEFVRELKAGTRRPATVRS